MLAFFSVLSVTFAILGARIREKMRERDAVAAIKGQDGWVGYDWVVRGAEGPPGPPWLRAILGHDCLATVVTAQLFSREPAIDADLDFLEGLPHLTYVCLRDGDLSLRGIERLASVPLERLILRHVSLADGGWKKLARLTSLRELSIEVCDLSDADLLHFTRFTRLEALGLARTRITKDGVHRLKTQLPRCRIYYYETPYEWTPSLPGSLLLGLDTQPYHGLAPHQGESPAGEDCRARKGLSME
jgi:hypothetical protein